MTFEGVVDLESTEDSGQALVCGVTADDDIEEGMFVRLQSWYDRMGGDPAPEHPELTSLIGKRVRVTIEVLDD